LPLAALPLRCRPISRHQNAGASGPKLGEGVTIMGICRPVCEAHTAPDKVKAAQTPARLEAKGPICGPTLGQLIL